MGTNAAEDALSEAAVVSVGQNAISSENDAAKGASPKSPLSVDFPGGVQVERQHDPQGKEDGNPISDVSPADVPAVCARIVRMSPEEAGQRLSEMHIMAEGEGCYVKQIELQAISFPDPLNPPQSRKEVEAAKDILDTVTVSFPVNIHEGVTYVFTAESSGKMPSISEKIVKGSAQIMQRHAVPHPEPTMAVLIVDVSDKEGFQNATGMLITDVEMPTDCGRATGVYECSPLGISSAQIQTFINIVDNLAADSKEGDKINLHFPNFFGRDNSLISYVFAILQPENSEKNEAMKRYLKRVEFQDDPVASTLLTVMPFCHHIRLMVAFGGGMKEYRHKNAGRMAPKQMKKKSLAYHCDHGLFEGCDIRLACSFPIEESENVPFCTFQNAVPYDEAHFTKNGLMLQAIGEELSLERKEKWKKAISDGLLRWYANSPERIAEQWAKMTPAQKQAQTQANEAYLTELARIKADTQAQLRAEAEEKEAKAKAKARAKADGQAKARAKAEEKEAKAKAVWQAYDRAKAEEKEAKAKAKARAKADGQLKAKAEAMEEMLQEDGTINMEAFRANNKTGWKGVSARGRRLMAEICKDGKKVHLGSFDTPEEAARAYAEAYIEKKRTKRKRDEEADDEE